VFSKWLIVAKIMFETFTTKIVVVF